MQLLDLVVNLIAKISAENAGWCCFHGYLFICFFFNCVFAMILFFLLLIVRFLCLAGEYSSFSVVGNDKILGL